MAVIHRQHNITSEGVTTTVSEGTETTTGLDRALATLRIAFGVTFLWAFLDKAFALGFGTGAITDETSGARTGIDFFAKDQAWFNGGSPTEGFLTFAVPADNPFKGFFNGLAGYAVVDWLFMLGLLGIGVTLLLGVGIRIGTAAGAAMYALMYAASIPLENNPVIDYHLTGLISMAVLGLAAVGTTWGLGGQWRKMPLVQKNPVLK